MDTSNESIIRALMVLQEVCKRNECIECPLRRSDGVDCELNYKAPVSWKINSADVTWRAFRD